MLPVVIVTQIEPNFIFNRRTFIRGNIIIFIIFISHLLTVSLQNLQVESIHPTFLLSGSLSAKYLTQFFVPSPSGSWWFGQWASDKVLLAKQATASSSWLSFSWSSSVSLSDNYSLRFLPPFRLLCCTTRSWTWFWQLSPVWRCPSLPWFLSGGTGCISSLLTLAFCQPCCLLSYSMCWIVLCSWHKSWSFCHSGLSITCNPDEFSIFNPPSGQTCQQWAGDFVSSFGGYLNNANATSNCEYCQYEVGDQYYTPLNISYDNRWRDVWIVFCFFRKLPSIPLRCIGLTSLLFVVFNMIATISEYLYMSYWWHFTDAVPSSRISFLAVR